MFWHVFKWMILNIALGMAHSHPPGATWPQGQRMFPIMCWDPEVPPQMVPSLPKATLLVRYGKCSQPRCCTHETQCCISKRQFLSFRPTFLTTPRCNEEHKHSLVNLYTQKGYSQRQANNREEAPVVLSQTQLLCSRSPDKHKAALSKVPTQKVRYHTPDY